MGGNYQLTLKKQKHLSSTNLHACSSQFVVCNTPLEQVKEYKYLGVMLSEKSIFKSTSKVLATQAVIELQYNRKCPDV